MSSVASKLYLFSYFYNPFDYIHAVSLRVLKVVVAPLSLTEGFIYQLFFHEFSCSPLLPNLLQP